MITERDFADLLPKACAWAEEQERLILRDGIPLSPAQLADARRVTLARPENVRLLKVPEIPIPHDQSLRHAAAETQLLSPSTAGLTLRYGIFIRADYWDDRRLLLHELVHTLQYERMGGFLQFLKQYLHECLTIGYPAAPMEQEATTASQRIFDEHR